MKQNKIITDYDIDILGEVGNIGAGNAATSLSVVLNTNIKLNISNIIQTKPEEIINHLKLKSEDEYYFISFDLHKALDGKMLYLIDKDNSNNIHKIASQGYPIDIQSVIQEISNMICGSYINAVASLMNEMVDITPPAVSTGKLSDLLKDNLGNNASQLFLVKTNMLTNDLNVSGSLILLLEEDSLTKLLNKLKDGINSNNG